MATSPDLTLNDDTLYLFRGGEMNCQLFSKMEDVLEWARICRVEKVMRPSLDAGL